jgi:xanthine dehydrogenase accessory factor
VNGLYQRIGELDPEKEHELITVTGGEHAGMHILLTQGQVAWSSRPDLLSLPENVCEEDVFREKLSPALRVVVCGCGFVGQAVIRLAKFLGWQVLAVDDRKEYLSGAEAKGADKAISGPFRSVLSRIRSDKGTCYVVVTREHQYDRECLDVILKRPFGYVGMMGSHHRAAMMKESLVKDGLDEKVAAMVHAPVGLPIKAQTPEEIAVSIIAQIIQEKEQFAGTDAFPEDLVKALHRLITSGDHGILALITSRKGSTPRKPGTRMLVYPDGHTVGTIGGGIMEAKVIRTAVTCLEQPSAFRSYSITIDLTGKTGEYADMLCGGMTQVFLELV